MKTKTGWFVEKVRIKTKYELGVF